MTTKDGVLTFDPELAKRLDLVRGTKDINALVAALLPLEEREHLSRCALVHAFDQHLFADVLRPSDTAGAAKALSFEHLVTLSAVEAVPRLNGWHRVREEERQYYLRQWTSSADASQSELAGASDYILLQRTLAAQFEAKGPGWEDEVLYHLLACDLSRAQALFERLYEEAERRFDLARCYNLLAILAERQADLGPVAPLTRRREELRQHLKLRTLTSEDYYRTSRYYEREFFRKNVEELLQQGAPWILELRGLDGMGKTMFLRWLMARQCVPRRIPCARIDFYHFPARRAGEAPWAFIGTLSEELNGQIPDAPFVELIKEVEEHRRILERPPEKAGSVNVMANRNDEFVDTFASMLRERVAGPVVITLDSLEEAGGRGTIDIPGIIECLERVHDGDPTNGQQGCPQLRLILAGRRTLQEKYPDVYRRVQAGLVTKEVPLFTPDESRGYLREKRKLPQGDLCEAVIERAKGIPLKLALLADAVTENPEITASEIRAYDPTNPNKDVDLVYLIGQVVRRVPSYEMRWLLRYGVVPRMLTRTFLKQVMVGHLRRALAGEPAYADPEMAGTPRADASGQTSTPPNIEGLWSALVAYAAQASWISQYPSDPDTLRFHPTVLTPMRRLLQTDHVFQLLHETAIEYWDHAAANEADTRGRLDAARESLYHRFQLHGTGAEAKWQELLEKAGDAPGWRRSLALEVLGPEYVDDDRKPLRRGDGSPMVTDGLLVRAHYELARANVELAPRTEPKHRSELVTQAQFALKVLGALATELVATVIGPPALSLVRAQLQRLVDPTAALQTARTALTTKPTPELRQMLERLCGDLYLDQKQPEAAMHYRAALELTLARQPRTPDVIAEVATLHERMARHYAEHDRLDAALRECDQALAAAGALPSDRAIRPRTELRTLQATLEVRSGLSARALATITRERKRRPLEHRIALSYVAIRALLDLRRPLRGLTEYRRAVKMLDLLRGQADDDKMRLRHLELTAEGYELHGRILGTLMEFGPALDVLHQARGVWQQLGGIEHANRCLQRAVELQLRELGNLRAAGKLLDDAERASLPLRDESQAHFSALRVEWHDRMGDGSAARETLDRVLSHWTDSGIPRVRARLALEGLARRAEPTPGPYLEQLEQALTAVDSAPARIALLGPLTRCTTLGDVSPKLVESLLALTEFSNDDDTANSLDPADQRALTLRRIELRRVVGDVRGAGRQLRQVAIKLAFAGDTFHVREVRRAKDRLGWTAGEPTNTPILFENFQEEFKAYSTLVGTFSLEEAERLNAAGRNEPARLCGKEVAALLDVPSSTYSNGSPGGTSGFGRLQSQWLGRYYELRAGLSPKSGPENRNYFLQRAIDIYDQLGDEIQKQRLARLLKEKGKSLDEETDNVVAMSFDSRSASLTVSAPGQVTAKPLLPQPAGGWLTGLFEEVEAQRAGSLAGVVPYQFLKHLIASWTPGGLELEIIARDTTAEHLIQRSRAEGPIDLRIEADRSALHAPPWELILGRDGELLTSALGVRHTYRGVASTFTRRERIKWAQVALTRMGEAQLLTDGIDAHLTHGAIGAFQRRSGLPVTGQPDAATRAALREKLSTFDNRGRLSVMLLQPSQVRAARAMRGVQAFGIGPDLLYRRHGCTIDVLEDPELAQLYLSLSRQVPEVLHISAGLQESPTLGGVYLDFATALSVTSEGLSPYSERNSALLTSSSLDRLLQTLPDFSTKPLVILDPPRPAGITEVMRQLFLRNVFAAELLKLGNVSGVLATGLAPIEEHLDLGERLVTAVISGLPLGAIARAVRGPSTSGAGTGTLPLSPELEQAVSTFGVTLFTHDPELTLVSPNVPAS